MADTPELELPTGERVSLDRPLVIGRGTEADVVIPDAEASRRHAQVIPEGEGFVLADLESRNGTRLNGERITAPRELKDGDTITLGRTAIVFRAPQATPSAPPTEVLSDVTATIVQPRLSPTIRQPVPTALNSPLQVLSRITRRLGELDDAREMAEAVTSALQTDYGCDAALLYLSDDSSASFYCASAACDAQGVKLLVLGPGEGVPGAVATAREPRLSGTPPVSAVERALGFETRSAAAAPLLGAGGKLLGVLEMRNPRRKQAFDADDLELVSLSATQLAAALSRASSWEAIERERAALARISTIRDEFVATTPQGIRLLIDAADRASRNVPVFLAGEPGTGKRLLARLAARAAGAAAPQEAAGADGLAAVGSAPAHLLSVQDIPLEAQEALAETLAARSGSTVTFVSGEAGLDTLVSTGRLAPALHRVLEGNEVSLPPLHARSEDLEALVAHFAGQTASRLKRPPVAFGATALDRFRQYSWPKNLAELRAVVHRVAVLTRDTTVEEETLRTLAPEIFGPPPGEGPLPPGPLSRLAAERYTRAVEAAQAAEPAGRLGAIPVLATSGSPQATDVLAALLGDPEIQVRRDAAMALGACPGASAALAARLEVETDADVAAAILVALAESGEATAHPVVPRALRATDSRMRQLAMRALRLSGGDTEAANNTRKDSDPGVRAEAFAALIAGGEPLAQELVALVSEGDEQARAATCQVLGELSLGEPVLLELAATADRPIRAAAIRALGTMRASDAAPALVELLGDAAVSAEAAAALARMGYTEAGPRLHAVATAPESPPDVRRASLLALARLAVPEAREAIATRLASADPGAVEAAALLGDRALESALLSAADSNHELPGFVAALETVGTERSVASLLAIGANDPESHYDVLKALTHIAGRATDRAAFFGQLEAAPESSRVLALETAIELDDPAAVPLYLRGLGGPDAAQEGLSRLGTRAVPGLIAALGSPQHEAAEQSLAALGPGVVRPLLPLLRDPAQRRAVARAVVNIGEPSLPDLVSALEAASPADQPPLLQLLGQVAPGRLAHYVATFLGAPEPPVRYAAIVALGNLPDARSESELLGLVDSPDQPAAMLATLALGRIQSALAFDQFVEKAGQGDRRGQYAIAGALSEYNLRQPPVLELIRRMVREGMPFSSAALEAGFASGAIQPPDVLDALQDPSVEHSQKLRLIGAVGLLPAQAGLPALLHAAAADLDGSLVPTLVGAIARHQADAADAVASLLLDPATRGRAIAILGAMQDPPSLMTILRRIAPALEGDSALRSDLRAMGDVVLGPLVDVISRNWELESLSLLWQLAEVIDRPASRTGAHQE